ncbi:MAG: hypothetical protein JSV99_10320 [Planctomycetota bacterium]|nr:MAG: hypothetical protein JSV99_10320 [Planctomycetota bacterium]
MGKRLGFLCVILVLSLSFAVQAQTDINVVNPSFELDANGVQATCGLDIDDGEVLGWASEGGFTGTSCDSNAPGACDDCWDHDAVTFWPDGGIIAWMYSDVGAHIFQHLDSNDANTVIAAGRRYTLSWWGLAWWNQALDATLFYGDNHDANEIVTVTQDMAQSGERPWDWYYGELTFVAESGEPYLGETLGIKFAGNTPSPDNDYSFMDDVHLTWAYATEAYDPNPGDGAELVTKNPTLTWEPGGWVDQHEVYFGTDETAVANADNTDTTGIYIDTRDPCSYTPPGPLELGKTYYWKITEVNSTPPGGGIPPGPWEGDVWSFRVEGHAHDPSPRDGETDVIFLGLDLEWTAGAEATRHLVYLGTDEQAVSDATTSSPEFEANLPAATESYAVGSLTVRETYYWRVDEKSAVHPAGLKGDTWVFQVGMFLVVDDFESYANNSELYQVWDDYWVNGSDGEIFLEEDVNIVGPHGNRSAKLKFQNVSTDKGSLIGSQFDVQDMTELDIGSDWTIGGVKSLFMYLRGDPCNVQVMYSDKKGVAWDGATPWVELEDTSSNVGYVVHPRGEMAQFDGWYEWNIDLGIFDACGVVLSAIDRFTIGIGGAAKTGQAKAMLDIGYMYVDDIRLYPSRCRPELGKLVGDFTEDCNVNYDDANVIATDWLLADGDTLTENRPATLTGFPDETSHWTTDCAVGTGAVKVNDGCDITVTDPRLDGVASMSITAWIKPIVGMNRWVGIVSSREDVGCGDDATEIGVYGGEYGGPDGLGYDWSCGTEEWQWDAGIDITDGVWTFVALSVDPCGATLYKREAGGNLQTGLRNVEAHSIQKNFSDHFVIGGDDKGDGEGYFQGAIDDVRIYAYALDFNDVNGLAYQTADPNPAPVYRYEFDETTGYTAADSGTPTNVYGPVPSVANLTDPEPKLQRFVNFADYAIFADNWMAQRLWPDW